MGIFWHLWEHQRVEQAASAASDARIQAATAEGEAARLRTEVDRLNLVVQAMWAFMREELNLTDEQLAAKVQEIDLSDGKLDGRVRLGPVACPKCGRPNNRRSAHCLYCGEALPAGPA